MNVMRCTTRNLFSTYNNMDIEDNFKMDPALGDIYISKLPSAVFQQLCTSMDLYEGWNKLACVFGYTMQEVLQFKMELQRQNGSPTHKLLWDLCTRNVTIGELHDKLMKCNHIQDMQILESASTILIKKKQAPTETAEKTPFPGTILIKKKQAPTETAEKTPFPGMSRPGKPGSWQSEHTVPVRDVQSENDNFFRSSINSKEQQPIALKTDEVKHYNDKIILGQSKSSQNSNCDAASVPVENDIESLQAPFGNLVVSNPAVSSVDVTMARIIPHYFTYKELSQATNDFSADRKLGEGAFGEVFLGTYLNTKFAIKRLFEKFKSNDTTETPSSHLASELTTLTRYRHENLVSLYGCHSYEMDGENVCLVYPYMPNGSLEDRIQCKGGSTPLTWEQRVNIARGAACGLQYLHTLESKPQVHGDMKSSNILLDKNFEARIADLGLACHAEKGSSLRALTHITKMETKTKAYQCTAYLALENKRGAKPSIKGDVFAFGVILLEICTGEKAYDDKREGDKILLADYLSERTDDHPEASYTDLQDRRVSSCRRDIYIQLFKLGLCCTKKKNHRPNMVQVYKELEQLENGMREADGETTDGASEPSSDKYQMSNTFSSSNNVSTPESSSDATNISFSSNGGYNPLFMAACQNQSSISHDKPSLDISSNPQVQSVNQAKSPIEMLPPGHPIPGPILLQMMQDNAVPSGIVKQGEQWVKAGCEYLDEYNDQTCMQYDPEKISEMEKFDKHISETCQRNEHPIRQLDSMIADSKMKNEIEKEKTEEMKSPASESVDSSGLQRQNYDEDTSLWMKQRRAYIFTNYNNNVIETNENNHISVEQHSERHEDTTNIPDTTHTNYDHAEYTLWHSNNEPTECEGLSNDTIDKCDDTDNDSMPSNCLSSRDPLPVTDMLEDDECLCNRMSEITQSWENSIVNMAEMKGPP